MWKSRIRSASEALLLTFLFASIATGSTASTGEGNEALEPVMPLLDDFQSVTFAIEQRRLKKTDSPTPFPTLAPTEKNNKNNDKDNDKDSDKNDDKNNDKNVDKNDDKDRAGNDKNSAINMVAGDDKNNDKNDNKNNDKADGDQWARPYQVDQDEEKKDTATNPPTRNPTRNPTQNPTSPPTRIPTASPTAVPTITPTTTRPSSIPSSVPSEVPTLPPTTATTTQLPTAVDSIATSTTSTDPKTIDYDQLKSIQVAPKNGSSYNVSIAFNLWFPDRIGVNGAEEAQGTHIRTGIISTLQVLFCDHHKGIFFEALGLEDYPKYNLCAFSENVVDGDSTVALSVGGGRRLKDDSDIEIVDAYKVVLDAFNKGKWDEEENKESDKDFEQWQKDRASDRAIYPVASDAIETGNGASNNGNEDGKDDEEDKGNDKDKKEDKGKENQKEQEADQEEENLEQLVLDWSVLLDPPRLTPHVHFNAHKNLAWTTWNITWPVVRLSVDYLERAWKLQSGSGDVGDIFEYGVKLMEQDMMKYLEENIQIKAVDVMLEGLIKEPVRASILGKGLSAYSPEAAEEVPEEILSNDDDDHLGYNTTVDEAFRPHPAHPLRLFGISMFVLTLKFMLILHCMSRRKKLAREAECERLRQKHGMLHSPEGVDEMLFKTVAAPPELCRPRSNDE